MNYNGVQAITRSGNLGSFSWNVGSLGNISLSGNRDIQWHAWTFVYVNENKNITLQGNGDCVPRVFINNNFDSPKEFPAVLNLITGWNRIDITGYNQNDSYSFGMSTELASLVTIMNSAHQDSTVSLPEFNPTPGNYMSPQTVVINCSTPNASIYYTTNGTDATESSKIYTNPINIVSRTTIKVRAFKLGWNPSGIASGTYEITGQLLDNDAGFELSFADGTFPNAGNWEPSSAGGSAFAVCTNTSAHTGNNGLWEYTGSESMEGWWLGPYQEFSSSAGKIYLGSAWIRTPAVGAEGSWVAGSRACIRIVFLNSSKSTLAFKESSSITTLVLPGLYLV